MLHVQKQYVNPPDAVSEISATPNFQIIYFQKYSVLVKKKSFIQKLVF